MAAGAIPISQSGQSAERHAPVTVTGISCMEPITRRLQLIGQGVVASPPLLLSSGPQRHHPSMAMRIVLVRVRHKRRNVEKRLNVVCFVFHFSLYPAWVCVL